MPLHIMSTTQEVGANDSFGEAVEGLRVLHELLLDCERVVHLDGVGDSDVCKELALGCLDLGT